MKIVAIVWPPALINVLPIEVGIKKPSKLTPYYPHANPARSNNGLGIPAMSTMNINPKLPLIMPPMRLKVGDELSLSSIEPSLAMN